MPIIGEVNHSQLGRVLVSARRNSCRATARWRNGLVTLNVPPRTGISDIRRILDGLAPRLLQCRPSLRYEAPSMLHLEGLDISITRQSLLPGKVLAKAALPKSYIEIGSDIDLSTEQATRTVSDMLCKIARKLAPEIILPQARRLAAEVGRNPAAWRISSGFRILGTCSAEGIISLSYVLAFLPADLREYIIKHELAHLSELNHSPRFHELLNRYLGGREAELTARLRKFKWPVLRK